MAGRSAGPDLTRAAWDEILAGKRPDRLLAVFYRDTWDCSLVEIKTDYPEGFFVIPFPGGQEIYDLDTGKTIGALNRKPMVKVGQQAPRLTIGRWLDGKGRTLEGLRGQVVVLDFWGLWCSGCRAEVPQLTHSKIASRINRSRSSASTLPSEIPHGWPRKSKSFKSRRIGTGSPPSTPDE